MSDPNHRHEAGQTRETEEEVSSAENQALLAPSNSDDCQNLSSSADLNSQPDTSYPAPALPENSYVPTGGHSKPSSSQTKLNTEPLPPSPPEPLLPKEQAVSTSIAALSDSGVSKEDRTSGTMSKQIENKDAAKRISGHGDVHLEMEKLNDPTAVEIIQRKNKGSKEDVTSFDNNRAHHMIASEEEKGHFLPKDDEEAEASDFDELDLDDLDRKDDAWRESNILSRAIIMFQSAVVNAFRLLNRLTLGYLRPIVFFVGFTIYFIMAMIYKFGDEGSHRLLGCTVFGAALIVFPYIKRFIVGAAKKAYGSDTLSEQHRQLLGKVRIVFRW
ncbi:hypothetical protein ElyMa_002662400 [Elysia marginata]|uniref:Uncharacterized protein n=1 Tax=Elysia marginata TaxID=1093978 RepID=A0AAV4HAT2_9GAST|nr:hypothetical protein ElyMa_002662400 [Elysia marginata]